MHPFLTMTVRNGVHVNVFEFRYAPCLAYEVFFYTCCAWKDSSIAAQHW